MQWNEVDLKRYVQAKEYVDTLIVPLIPFQLSEDADLPKTALQGEVMSLFLNELEKELTGRVMLMPPYYYLKTTVKATEVERINTWIADAYKQPFNHTFLFSFDSTWKKIEQSLKGTLLWLPSIHTNDIHSKEMRTIVREQVEQVGELLRSYW